MELGTLSPDDVVYLQRGFVEINATLVFSWVTMFVLCASSVAATWRVEKEAPSRWQLLLESIVEMTRTQVREVMSRDPGPYLPFIGTLFLFIAVANLLTVVPGYISPMGSLSTAATLAGCVFLSVPLYGIVEKGLLGYLARYVRPNPFMLPFHVVGELSRTLAMAVRLFGNVMSATKLLGLIVAIAPLFLPILLAAFGLLTGLIQAYIFAVLALIYIASAVRSGAE